MFAKKALEKSMQMLTTDTEKTVPKQPLCYYNKVHFETLSEIKVSSILFLMDLEFHIQLS